jgi:hypothetical protein
MTLTSTMALKLAAVGGLAYLALRKPSAKSPPPAPATDVPTVGKPWSTTVVDELGITLPAIPVTKGGSSFGWYHPLTHGLLAITEKRGETHVVVSTSPNSFFPARLP